MENNEQNYEILNICRNNSKDSFIINISEIDMEFLNLNDLRVKIDNNAKSKGFLATNLSFFQLPWSDLDDKKFEEPLSYYKDLFPIYFNQEILLTCIFSGLSPYKHQYTLERTDLNKKIKEVIACYITEHIEIIKAYYDKKHLDLNKTFLDYNVGQHFEIEVAFDFTPLINLPSQSINDKIDYLHLYYTGKIALKFNDNSYYYYFNYTDIINLTIEQFVLKYFKFYDKNPLELELYYEDKKLDKNLKLIDYGITHESNIKTNKQINIKDQKIYIFVKTLTGKTITLGGYFGPYTTISQFKDIIYDKEGIPLHLQVLYYSGQVLEDEGTIYKYNIQKECTITLILILKGGGMNTKQFVDLSKNETIELEYSPTAPEWRYVNSGLNLFGTCKNSKCKAYNNEVVCPIDKRVFDLILNANEAKCPICNISIIPDTCGFTSCNYIWTGIKLENGNVIKFTNQIWTKVGGEFKYFPVSNNGVAEWSQLKIITKLDNYFKEYCGLCNQVISANKITKDCGHIYHDGCSEEVEKVMNVKCVLCK